MQPLHSPVTLPPLTLSAGNKAGISIHPSDAVRLHLADGAYVVVVWMDVRSVLRDCGSGGKLCDNEYHHIHDFKPS